MIYRLLLCGLLFTSAFTLIAAGVLSDHILSLVYRRPQQSFLSSLSGRLLTRSHLLAGAALAVGVAIALVWPGVVEFVSTGHVTIHWSRPMAAVFLLQFALLAAIYAVLEKIVELWQEQLSYDTEDGRDAQYL